MSQRSTSVEAPESEAPATSEAPAISEALPTSLAAPDSADTPSSEPVLPKPEKKKSSGAAARWGGDTTKFRHFLVHADNDQYDVPAELPRRPGFNTTGQAVAISINSFPILKFPDQKIFQYDVSLPRSPHLCACLICCAASSNCCNTIDLFH